MPYNHAGPGQQGNDAVSSLILVVLAVFFPPAVPLIISGCSVDFCINLLLTILAFFPGIIHALWLIYKQAKANEQYGRGQYIYAGNGHYQPAPGPAHPSYGATAGPMGVHHQPPPPQQHAGAGGAYVPGREPWEGQQQHQQHAQAPPPGYKQ